MADYLLKRPMLLCGIACLCIGFVGFYSKALLIFFAIALIYIFILVLKKRLGGVFIFATLLVALTLLRTVCTAYDIEKAEALAGKECQAEIVVCETDFRGDDYDRSLVEVVSSDLLAKDTRLLVYTKQARLSVGKFAVMDLKLNAIKPDYRSANYAEKTYLLANSSNVSIIENRTDFVLTAINRMKSYIRTTIFSMLDFNEAATVCGLILGEQRYFDDGFYDNVKRSGVSHVMVVSGMHLSIFVMLVTYMTRKFMYNRYFSALLMLISVLIVAALCGFTPSVTRAGITYILTATALIINRPNTPENTLGGAVAIISIISPFAFFSVALQLSLLSTFGILVVAANIIKYVREKEIISSKLLFALFSTITITLSALIMTLPVAIYNFRYISTVAVVTNLLIAPVVSWIIWLAVCGLLVSLFLPIAAEMIFTPCEILTKYINAVINFFGGLSFSVLKTPEFTAFIAIAIIVAIFWVMLACKVRQDMLKSELVREKLIKEGGRTLKWR